MAKRTGFAAELRTWRGKRLQKEAADILGVPLDTYRGWEYESSKPSEAPSMCEIRQRMSENPQKEAA